MRKFLLIFLFIPMLAQAQYKWGWDWYNNAALLPIYPPTIDTNYPYTAFDTTGYASFDGINDFVAMPGTSSWAYLTGIPRTVTDSFRAIIWLKPSWKDAYIFGKRCATQFFCLGHYATDGHYYIYFPGSGGTKQMSTFTRWDTARFSKIEFLYTKSDSNLYFWKNDSLKITTKVPYAVDSVTTGFGFMIGHYYIGNLNGQPLAPVSNPTWMFDGEIKTLFLRINTSTYYYDFRAGINPNVFDSSATQWERMSDVDKTLQKGFNQAPDISDVSYTEGTRTYTSLLDTAICGKGLNRSYGTAGDTTFADSYTGRMCKWLYNDTLRIVLPGFINLANNPGVKRTEGDTISPGIAILRPSGQFWDRIGWGFTSGIAQSDWTMLTTFTNATQDTLYSGGYGERIYGGDTCFYIAYMTANDTNWRALGSTGNRGLNNVVAGGCSTDTSVIICGWFTKTYDLSTTLNYICSYRNGIFSPMGTGANDVVWTVENIDGDIWAGGSFTSIGGVTAQGLAKFSGGTWSAIPGIDSTTLVFDIMEDSRGWVWVASNGMEIDGTFYDLTVYKNGTWYGYNITGYPAAHGVTQVIEYNGYIFIGGMFLYTNGTKTQNLACFNPFTNLVYPIAQVDKRVEGLLVYTINSIDYLIISGDQYTIDGYRCGNVGALNLTTLFTP